LDALHGELFVDLALVEAGLGERRGVADEADEFGFVNALDHSGWNAGGMGEERFLGRILGIGRA
jgi:hypothetical protein